MISSREESGSPVKATKTKPTSDFLSDFESDDSFKINISDPESDEELASKKKKPAPKKGKSTNDDSDSDFGMSKKKPAVKSTAPRKKATDNKPKAKKEAPKREKLAVTKSKPAPKKKYSDSDDSLKLDGTSDEEAPKKNAVKRKASSSDSDDFTVYSKKKDGK